MTEMFQLEFPIRSVKLCKIEGGKITSRIIQEHIFGTRIRRVDATVLRTGMPFVDGGIVLSSWIGANPGRPRNPVPQLPRLDGLADLAVCSTFELPIAVSF